MPQAVFGTFVSSWRIASENTHGENFCRGFIMKLVLVNPPRSHVDVSEVGPPAGLLQLGRIAQLAGWNPVVVDFNLLWHTKISIREGFYSAATDILADHEADVYGFTSMAVDSHIALSLGQRVKARVPSCQVVLGGVHFSSCAAWVLENCPWVDQIITGEAREIFFDYLCERGGRLPMNRPSELQWPSPSYDLIDICDYFKLNNSHLLDFERARGCRFKCVFCYSPNFYSNTAELEVDATLERLASAAALGVRQLFFVEDNFLNQPKSAIRFCNALSEAKMPITWHAYATLPQLSEELIQSMARAGCRGLFFGVDAVGTRTQSSLQKKFFRSDGELERAIDLCLANEISPTLAFLVAPTSHPLGDDFEITMKVALMSRARGALVRLNPLLYYEGTAMANAEATTFDYDELRSSLMLDFPSELVSNSYARKSPRHFPFHSRYVAADEWRAFIERTHVLFTLLYTNPDELIEMIRCKKSTFQNFADNVRSMVGPLVEILPQDRRRTEANAAVGAFANL